MSLPIVSPGVFHSVFQGVRTARADDWRERVFAQMCAENEELARYTLGARKISEGTDEEYFVDGLLTMYALLRSQAEADAMNKELV